MSHRKLFPAETKTNQTLNCYGFCDPSCPSNCYTDPNYFYFPPPPPQHSNQVNHISSYLIILISLFTITFILVGFYVIKIKCYAEMCGWRSGPARSQTQEFLDDGQLDHPVWLIATVGLQQSIINSITICKYRKDEGLIEGTECSICLNEFQEGETLRLLPKCNHAFHIPCIDTWLRSHTNCPLCRARIVSNNVDHEVSISNFEQENNNLGRNQETLMENTRDYEGGLNVDLENLNATRGESSEVFEISDESNSKEQVLNDPNQNCTKACRTMRRSSIEECLHIRPVPMKRSFSWNGRILSTRGYMNLISILRY